MSRGFPVDLDGVWNVVLACRDCNRGDGGKMSAIPASTFLDQLRLRNEYLIWSHHPLKDTLIRQTGRDPDSRRMFLKRAWDMVGSLSIKTDWRTPEQDRPVFGCLPLLPTHAGRRSDSRE